jgi:hypothetical protein
MWCIPQVDGEFVARMEDVLDLYAEAPDPKRPVVCFDESPTQLIGEVRRPIKAEPGQIERYDCEYKRNGTANLFIFLDVHRPWRKVKVTDTGLTKRLRDHDGDRLIGVTDPATQRSARSAALFVMHRRPSSRKRTKPLQRLRL